MKAAPIAALLLAFAGAAFGEAHEKPKTYALVSAIGNEISYVRQRRSTGTNISPYRRYPVHVPDGSLDAAVLRGLDRAVAQEDPDSKRVFLRLAPDQLTGIHGVNRGGVISRRVMDDLEHAAERKDWDRIILVTPRFVNVGSSHMGDKLQGIGIYVQPIGRSLEVLNGDETISSGELATSSDPDTFSPDGTASSSYTFTAPYFYADIWIIDARTLQVLEKKERYDFVRYYDPDGGIDPSANLPTTVLAQKLTTFVERASSKAFHEAVGEVTVKEPRIVSPATK